MVEDSGPGRLRRSGGHRRGDRQGGTPTARVYARADTRTTAHPAGRGIARHRLISNHPHDRWYSLPRWALRSGAEVRVLLPALRTTNASRGRLEVCIIALAIGSAPIVRPPTASNYQSAVSSSLTLRTSMAVRWSRVSRRMRSYQANVAADDGSKCPCTARQVDDFTGLVACGHGPEATTRDDGLDHAESYARST